MKKKFLLTFIVMLLSIIIFSAVNVSAATYNDLTYTISNGKVKITDCDTTASGELVIPNAISGYPVTEISSWAFSDCENVSSILIPDSITTIGEFAFRYCNKLTSITLPASVKSIGRGVFFDCENLTNIIIDSKNAYYSSLDGNVYDKNKTTFIIYAPGKKDTKFEIPNSVTSIEEVSFWKCTMLKNVIIPNSVVEICEDAFYGCTGLTSIAIPDSVVEIGGDAFRACTGLTSITVGDGVTQIGDYAFSGCTKLISITLGKSLTKINSYVFDNCISLKSMVVPDSVTNIGYAAFQSCTSLANLTLGKNLKTIGSLAFLDCDMITTVEFPNGVTSVGSMAFRGCDNLASITIPDSVTEISSGVFYNTKYYNEPRNWEAGMLYIDDCLISVENTLSNLCSIKKGTRLIADSAFASCSKITGIIIPNSVTTIGMEAFRGCESLKNIVIPNSVTTIRTHTFTNCKSLEKVTLPDSITQINDRAFLNCENLKNITIPDNVTVIDEYTFTDCSNLEYIKIPSSITHINQNAFNACDKLTDVYYSGQEHQWKLINIGANNSPLQSAKIHLNSDWSDEGDAEGDSIQESYSNGLSYIVSTTTGDATIIGCDTNLTGELVIPPSIDGHPVTSIESSAFYGCASLTSITVPDSVIYIAPFAFSGCIGLESITLPFVGSSRNTNEGSNALFSYIFGNISSIPSSLKKVTITDTTIIPKDAFENCTGLTEIIIPEGVTSIEQYAFAYCSSLKKITFPTTVIKLGWNAFLYCENLEDLYIEDLKAYMSLNCGENNCPTFYAHNIYLNGELLTDVVIPDGVTTIKSHIFRDNDTIKSISIPKTVNTIYCSAFNGCDNIESINVESLEAYLTLEYYYDNFSSITTYLSQLADRFYVNGKRVTKIEIPNTLTKIPKYAFYNCTSLTDIVIPDSVTSIEEYAFYGSGLTNIQIPDHIDTINSYVFANCGSLTEVTLGDHVNNIGKNAFSNCKQLKDIKNLENVTNIGDYAFYSCSSLTSIDITEKVKTIGKYAFAFSGLKSIFIPGSVSNISSEAFYYCSSLTKVSVGEGIKTLPASIFASCYRLTDVELPSSLKTIGVSAFSGCSGLTSIIIPRSVMEIEQKAFEGCSKLSTVYYNGTQSEWDDIYIALYNDPFVNAEKRFFRYVTIIDENGEQLSQKMYDVDSLIDISDIEEKFEHTIHLYTDEDCTNEYNLSTPISENLTLYLKYIPNQYLTKFVDYDGELIWEGLIDYGAVITPPENPIRERTQQYTYTFAGWDGFTDGLTQTNREMIFTATYDATVNQYTYKFLDNDDTVLKELKVDYGTIIEVPENPDDKDPYTFNYWEDYQDGMELTDDIFFKAVYKYKTYYVTVAGLDKVYDIVYNDAFELETQVPEEEYLFMGYYTEENGKGTRVTDEDGVCIANYNFLTDITVYPYFPHELLNKIKINGEDSTVVGSSDVVKKVYFATDKVASYLLCTIKYPESITLKEIIEKDFMYISEESKTVTDGYVYQNLICQYTDNLDNLPYNKKVAPFELVFDIPTNTAPQNASIEITADSMLFGEEDYPFEYIINGNLEIAAKPVEGIEISGQDEVVLEDGKVTYTAIITPDWATNTDVEWSVSDESIAIISKDGVLTPVSVGTVTITATAKDGSGVVAEKIITIKEFAKIKTLLSDIGQWNKEFDSSIREYTIYVPYDADSISFKPTFTSGRLTINNSFAVNNRFNSVKITEDSNVIFVRTNASGYANSEYKITIIRYEGTKTTVSEDGNSFVINPINIETRKTVILSLYEDGEFVETQTATFEGEAMTFITDKSYTNAKVMVWDSLANLKPVCNVEIVK